MSTATLDRPAPARVPSPAALAARGTGLVRLDTVIAARTRDWSVHIMHTKDLHVWAVRTPDGALTVGPRPGHLGEDFAATARSIRAALLAAGWDGSPVVADTRGVANSLDLVEVPVKGIGGPDQHAVHAAQLAHARTLIGPMTLTLSFSGAVNAKAPRSGAAGALVVSAGPAGLRVTATATEDATRALCELAAAAEALSELAERIGEAAEGLEVTVRTRHRATAQLLADYDPRRTHPAGPRAGALCKRILGRKHQPVVTVQVLARAEADQACELAGRLGRLGRRHAASDLPAQLTHQVGERIAQELSASAA